LAELVQNPEDVETLVRIGIPRAKLHLLGNGIDLQRLDRDRLLEQRQRLRQELGVNDDEVVIGAVGRLVAEKGYPEPAQGNPARLLVVGPEDPDKAVPCPRL
jgi:glycosyltransferase involved in cell wall biosynthesis